MTVAVSELESTLPAGSLTTDGDVIDAYSRDNALFCPIGRALALVRAKTIDDVVQTMKFAHQYRIPVVTQGARTGLAGGANASEGSILLNLASMDSILSVDPIEKTCTVQPGVINGELKTHLRQYSLAYPPDPGSVAISTIGGNVATNAGGFCCVKYGVTRDFVRNLTVVMADGTLVEIGRNTAKNSAGLDLAQLLIGSEGTLGVIVEITLDLVPALPEVVTAVAFFDNEDTAATVITESIDSGINPSLVEYMDAVTIEMVNAYAHFGLPEEAAALLLVQTDGGGNLEIAAAELQKFAEVVERLEGAEVMISDDPADSEMLVAARRAVGPAQEKYSHDTGTVHLVDDVCLPRRQLGEFFTFLRKLDDDNPEIVISVAAHAGDGNTHPVVYFDPQNSTAEAVARKVFGQIMEEGLRLGGTITGEHGVGYLKREWLMKEISEPAVRIHSGIKSVFDPLNLLNPGKLLHGMESVPQI